MMMKATTVFMLAAACALIDMAHADAGLQVELQELRCSFAKPAAQGDSSGFMRISNPPCVLSLRVSADSADMLLCEMEGTDLTATDAKGNKIKIKVSESIGMPKRDDDGQSVTVQLNKLPKGGSVTLTGTLTARVAAGADTHAPQEFDATKGGSFKAGDISYTLAAPVKKEAGAEPDMMGFLGFGPGSDGGTSVVMTTPDVAAIKDVKFTTADGKAVRTNGTMSMGNTVTYMLDTKETKLKITISTYKGTEKASCPVDMTVSMSGEVKKKSAAAAAEEQPKPKQKKPKKK